jgi:adenylate cyclase
MERRLSAIMAADVVGYSRLMGANEVATLTSFKTHRAELIDPAIAEYQGRIVKLTGDGMLVEFPSVVNAVDCAAEVQRGMRQRNLDVAEDRRIEFRIGINLGDVIVDDDDLYGDGVNVAARLETVAKPGGVAVSQSVRDNVGNRLDLQFEDIGDQQLKNIEFPVRVYNVVFGDAPTRADGAAAAAAAADKPSIAVLPFNNMSGDPEQEYFSDGITEDIITDLSKVSGLFVVGRNTSFGYKGMSPQLQQVAADLGVKCILEGSVRKAGGRVRVNAQLIDGSTGGHLWADRYDRDLTDIFAIQDEITHSIVEQLKIRLLPKEKKAIGQAPTANVEAYTYYLKARQFFHNWTRNSTQLARRMFAKAVEIDPLYARAYAGLANCDYRLDGWYNVPPPADILETAAKAIALDPELAEAHAARGAALANTGRRADAREAFERALKLDPNNFDACLEFARFCVAEGDHERAAELFIRAVEAQPDDPQAALLVHSLLERLGRAEEAEKYRQLGLRRAEEALRQHPESSRPAQLGACTLASMGERDKAIDWLNHALAIDPDDPNVIYNAACVYSLLGESEQSLDLLDRWVMHAGGELYGWIQNDVDLDPIRTHPRYPSLLAKIEKVANDRLAGHSQRQAAKDAQADAPATVPPV